MALAFCMRSKQHHYLVCKATPGPECTHVTWCAGVQLAYDAKLAHMLMVHPARQPSGKRFIPQVPWSVVQQNPIPEARFPTRFVNSCCQHFARLLLLCQQRNILPGRADRTSWFSNSNPIRPLIIPSWLHF